MKYGTFKVRQFAETSIPDIIIKDNGNGKALFTGTPAEAGRSPFAGLYVEYVSFDIKSKKLVLSIHHDEVIKVTGGEETPQYRRVCISRCGYAVVPGDTDEAAITNAKKLREHDFDWEVVDSGMIEASTSVVEVCGPNGEALG